MKQFQAGSSRNEKKEMEKELKSNEDNNILEV